MPRGVILVIGKRENAIEVIVFPGEIAIDARLVAIGIGAGIGIGGGDLVAGIALY